MRQLFSSFAVAAIKVFVPCGYGVWFLKLASNYFEGRQLLIFIPVYILSLIGIWRVTVLTCRLIERAIVRQRG